MRSRVTGFALTITLHVLLVLAVLCTTHVGTPSSLGQVQTSSGAETEVSLLQPTPSGASRNAAQAKRDQDTAKPARSDQRSSNAISASAENRSMVGTQSTADPDIVIGSTASTSGADFRERLRVHIATFESFPVAALQARLQDHVVLLFVMDRSGRVLYLHVWRSSRHSFLDHAAADAVLHALPLPPIPLELSDPLQISLPFDFDIHVNSRGTLTLSRSRSAHWNRGKNQNGVGSRFARKTTHPEIIFM